MGSVPLAGSVLHRTESLIHIRPRATRECPPSVTSSSIDRPRPPLSAHPATITSDGRTEEETVERQTRQASRPAQGFPTEAQRVPAVSQSPPAASRLPDLRHLRRTRSGQLQAEG